MIDELSSEQVATLVRDVHQSLVQDPRDDWSLFEISKVVDLHAPLMSRQSRDHIARIVLSEMDGLGPLDALLADDAITDVMVVGHRGVWIEREGALRRVDMQLQDAQVEHLIERVVAPLGLRVDRAAPMVDARLADGSRVNAIVAPLAVDGPCLTIRRFGAREIPLESFCSTQVAAFLQRCVHEKKNIIISGGTGAGKTTLLNALASSIGQSERVVTIEDAAELRLPLRHVVRLESRPPNTEGAGAVSIHQLLRNALRMRPDRIIVGECRGAEAIDMLQAMNTGHDGSMSTLHANSPADAMLRLETMILSGASNLPLAAVRQQIASSVDVIVQIKRTRTAARTIVDVASVERVGGELVARSLIEVEAQ